MTIGVDDQVVEDVELNTYLYMYIEYISSCVHIEYISSIHLDGEREQGGRARKEKHIIIIIITNFSKKEICGNDWKFRLQENQCGHFGRGVPPAVREDIQHRTTR